MIQKLKNVYHLIRACIAVIRFGFPTRSYCVIGVTGTDGKTTTATLLYEILKNAGYNTALISTISAKIGDREYDTGFHVTTPDPWQLQKFFSLAKKEKVTHLVLEVTSHGLDQQRVFGVDFDIGILTNVSHEHLDYHKTYLNYVKVKAKLLLRAKVAIINRDDESYPLIKQMLPVKKNIITFGLKQQADIWADGVQQTARGMSFVCQFSKKQRMNPFFVHVPLWGAYNVSNTLAAIGAAGVMKVKQISIQEAVQNFSQLVGRMEVIDEGQDFTVIVDFAHTPNALKEALLSVRKRGKGRVIVVFGCAGLRDRKKRPMMGKIACELADVAVFTAEDPRTEDVQKIIDQMVVGAKELNAKEKKDFYRIPERKDAIEFAIKELAKKEDTVIITGKGHEKSMCFGTTEYPWSDQEVVRAVLQERG